LIDSTDGLNASAKIFAGAVAPMAEKAASRLLLLIELMPAKFLFDSFQLEYDRTGHVISICKPFGKFEVSGFNFLRLIIDILKCHERRAGKECENKHHRESCTFHGRVFYLLNIIFN
jgi:hypothetical protein